MLQLENVYTMRIKLLLRRNQQRLKWGETSLKIHICYSADVTSLSLGFEVLILSMYS